MNQDVLTRYETLGTAIIADVFDTIGKLPNVIDNDIRPWIFGENAVAGWAFTITGEVVQYGGESDPLKLQAIDSLTPDTFAVWAGNGIAGMCCFGDLLAAAMKARGCRGALVDGGIRDWITIRETSFPVLARYTSPAQSIGRWRVTGYKKPVQLAGALTSQVTIAPGDLILADPDGVVTVPRDMIQDVLQRGETILANEGAARQEIAGGMLLRDAIKKYGHL